ncbi:RNA polymerase sigma factor, sigma-70 family [Filimonas lacunae]|uniref:RNA polymerase sigma factor, sigma-70 family n=1 Tax=Filimonas lacunae TaxID=477680 RepID=A0A173MJT5_9BACT|nr:RNA polymerase sigma factor [Filimonas lacunae]BAV07864.1 RNA polymerase ECF-type sigma factor [Filimonas lacunae]SIT05783.1 RNA polymerase sigma factor, sigma-70 family [Filimonas lacunae]
MNTRSLHPEDENRLWSRFCKGERDAFDTLYATYFPVLFQYCIRFTSDRSLIKDVLQDFFITLFLKPPKSSAVKQVKSYLLVSVRRQLLKALQKEAAGFQTLDDEAGYDFELELAADNSFIEKQEAGGVTQALQQMIRQLTPRQREAVYLYFFENIGYEQIADMLDMKEIKYARTLIYRALEDMRDLLAQNQVMTDILRNAAFAKQP